jgi:Tetracyclin repressor-like, C-terminal domain
MIVQRRHPSGAGAGPGGLQHREDDAPAGIAARSRPGDAAHIAAADAVLRVVFAVLAGYGITGKDAIDAVRALRAVLHGFLTLEADGFGMPRDIDRSYQRFITAFDTALGALGALGAASAPGD